MSLSSMIVQREVATMRQVEEALARQVIYGGDLVTNLLEVAHVEERVLGQLLAESLHLVAAPSGVLPRATNPARALVPVEMAVARLIVPIDATTNALVLAVADPLPSDVKDQLAFALGMQIEERAAPAVRVWQAIAAAYGVPLDRRMQRLVGRLEGGNEAAGPSPPPVDARLPAPGFVERTSAQPTRMSPPPSSTAIAGASAMRAIPGRRTTLMSFPGTRTFEPPPSFPEAENMDLRAPRSLAESAPGPLAVDAAGARRRRRGPITLATARSDADEAVDRNTLLALFFDYSRQFFEYSALFSVQGDIAEGRDGFGSGATRERVLGIGMPLDLPSVLSRARVTRTVVVATGLAEGLDAGLLKDLQRPRGAQIVVVPLVVRTRVVALLVGDWGDSGVDGEAVDQVKEFSGVVSKAFERIIVRRKLEGLVAGSRIGAHLVSSAGARDETKRPPLAPPAASAVPAGHSAAMGAEAPPLVTPPPAGVVAVRPVGSPPMPTGEPPWDPHAKGALSAINELIVEPGPEPRLDASQRWPLEDNAKPNSSIDEASRVTSRQEANSDGSAICVPLRRPPSGRTSANDALPSVIVDVERELEVVVDRLLAGESDEQAEGELMRQGEQAMRVLMARFPGPLTIDRALLGTLATPPRASECGPLLRLIARERKVALPFVLERMSDPDGEVRGWATHLLGELPYAEALPSLLVTLCDGDAPARASAALAIGAVAKGFGEQVFEALDALATAPDPRERAAALRAVGEVRDSHFVPALIRSLGDPEEAVVAAARDALVLTTRQDFVTDAPRWSEWWSRNSDRHRLEWLIDALSHETSDVRKASGEELRVLSRQYFGYASDLPPRDRERAQQRYRDWWITEGRTARRWA